jgi:hypothetical protein
MRPPEIVDERLPLDRFAADEVGYVARHLDTVSDGTNDVVVELCSGEWSWPSVNLPSVRRVDRYAESFDDLRAANR